VRSATARVGRVNIPLILPLLWSPGLAYPRPFALGSSRW
jgi:hypothetical protein